MNTHLLSVNLQRNNSVFFCIWAASCDINITFKCLETVHSSRLYAWLCICMFIICMDVDVVWLVHHLKYYAGKYLGCCRFYTLTTNNKRGGKQDKRVISSNSTGIIISYCNRWYNGRLSRGEEEPKTTETYAFIARYTFHLRCDRPPPADRGRPRASHPRPVWTPP